MKKNKKAKMFSNEASNYIASVAVRMNYFEDILKKHKRDVDPSVAVELYLLVKKNIEEIENMLKEKEKLVKSSIREPKNNG